MARRFSLDKLLPALFLTFLLTTSCMACVSSIRELAPDLIQDREPIYNDSVVMISSISPDGSIEGLIGSGFAVSEDLIVTAGHVCAGIQERIDIGVDAGLVLVKVDDRGRPQDSIPAGILKFQFSEEKDNCIILSQNHGLTPLPLANLLDYTLVRIHDSVTIVGSPRGIPYVQSSGTILVVGDDILRIRSYIDGGNSGGPVIYHGKVIGIVVAYSNAYRFHVVATPLREIRDALNSL